jgi:molecular chaperone GrpE (heat shock protein)
MSKIWTMWAVVFVAAGVSGLGLVAWNLYQEDKDLQPYRNQFSQNDNEYLQLYEEWNHLTPEQKEENPWGQGHYGGSKTQEQIRSEQPARLKADLVDLATGAKEPHVLADLLYGSQWQDEVDQYRRKKEIRDAATFVSIITLLAGTLILLGNTAKWLTGKLRNNPVESPAFVASGPASVESLSRQPVAESPVNRFAPETPIGRNKAVSHRRCSDGPGMFDSSKWNPSDAESDQDSVSWKTEIETLRENAKDLDPITAAVAGVPVSAFPDSVPVQSLMSTAPVVSDLAELTEQVSAIREFAAQQQDRVRQLQEGYDWNIIKRFCLRIIHCIDNLDTRIQQSASPEPITGLLRDVRDELVFALESSGVEQFEPQPDSDYKGLEKRVEAVKDRVPATQPRQRGKIAEIVRPGYEYVLSDQEARVVRCAQVKLYS